MCLAIPGRVIRWIESDPLEGTAEVEFGGVRRVCHMACVPTAAAGDFVIVHAGVAISIMDTVEADRVLDELAAIATGEHCSANGWRAGSDHLAADSLPTVFGEPGGSTRKGDITG